MIILLELAPQTSVLAAAEPRCRNADCGVDIIAIIEELFQLWVQCTKYYV